MLLANGSWLVFNQIAVADIKKYCSCPRSTAGKQLQAVSCLLCDYIEN
jgi:hypothetical protein